MINKKLAVFLSIVVLFYFSPGSFADGLHFGIIDAIEGKVGELEEELATALETGQGQTDSTGHARFYSEIIGDEIDVEVKDEARNPVENLDVTYITDGEKVYVRISDPAGNYYSELAEQDVASFVFISIIVIAVVVVLGFPIARIVIWEGTCFPTPPGLGGTCKKRLSGSLDDIVSTITELGYDNVRVCSQVSSTLGIEEGKGFEMQLPSGASSAYWKWNFLEKGFRENAVYDYGYYETLFRGDPVLQEPFWIDDVEVTEIENNPPNTPGSPSPADGATGQSINTDLSWTGGDPDSGDTVTYDVYFEANDSSPDVLVSDNQSETTYDPGTLNYDTHYYWKIIAMDNHGVSSSGPVWSFTTARIIIPFASITLDGNPPEWGSIDPVCIDAQGDDNTAYTGADIKSFKFAQDSNYLYVMADFYDGIPNTALGQADLWAYQFHFAYAGTSGGDLSDYIDSLGVSHDGSQWDINYLSLLNGVSGSLTGSSVAVDSVIELKIPKNKLLDSFDFCLQIGTDLGIDGVLGDITEWKTLYQS